MRTYRGACHCGAIRFEFRTPEITTAMRCDCSICLRKGMIMTADTIPPENMAIDAAAGALETYRFGTRTAKHHFCGTCGIHTFVETRLNPGHYRVNLGCVDDIDVLGLPAEIYNGRAL